jgi:hypothetical protein
MENSFALLFLEQSTSIYGTEKPAPFLTLLITTRVMLHEEIFLKI